MKFLRILLAVVLIPMGVDLVLMVSQVGEMFSTQLFETAIEKDPLAVAIALVGCAIACNVILLGFFFRCLFGKSDKEVRQKV